MIDDRKNINRLLMWWRTWKNGFLTDILLFILITSKAQSRVCCAGCQIDNRVKYKKKTKEQQRGTQEEEEEEEEENHKNEFHFILKKS